jgi:hypothetical protein
LNIETIALPAVITVYLAASLLLISSDWRMSISALALQYAGIVVLVGLSWPLEQAVVKMVAGWMAGAVLGLALIGLPGGGRTEPGLSKSNILFRLFGAILVGFVAYSWGPIITTWMPEVTLEQAYGGIVLLALGLFHLGLATHPLRVVLGLLTVLGGFEIMYAAIESSSLVTGLLAGISLGLALVGSYFLTVPIQENIV